jgi:hypothetical protein
MHDLIWAKWVLKCSPLRIKALQIIILKIPKAKHLPSLESKTLVQFNTNYEYSC